MSEVLLVIKHGGKIYKRGPHPIIRTTTSKRGDREELKYIKEIANEFASEIVNEIKAAI